jgi:hypothetical protein
MLQVLGKPGTWRDNVTGVRKTRVHNVIMVQRHVTESWDIGHISLSRSYCIYLCIYPFVCVFYKINIPILAY